MNSNQLKDLTLGAFLRHVLAQNEIEVCIRAGPVDQSANYEHLRLTPVNLIDLNSLRDLINLYYTTTEHRVIVFESDGRHFRIGCAIEDTKFVVEGAYNFEGEECFEIIVT